MKSWVVSLEAVPAGGTGAIEVEGLRCLVAALDAHPAALHTHDRCAVQLRVAATNQAQALQAAFGRWDTAVRSVALPPLEVVRAEVVTPEEFEREFDPDNLLAALARLEVPAPRSSSSADAEELISGHCPTR